jgi:hypothetical protein
MIKNQASLKLDCHQKSLKNLIKVKKKLRSPKSKKKINRIKKKEN